MEESEEIISKAGRNLLLYKECFCTHVISVMLVIYHPLLSYVNVNVFKINSSFIFRFIRRKAKELRSLDRSNPFAGLEIHKCLQCSYQTTSKISLTRHLLVQNRPREIETFQCQECLLETKSKVNLERHLLVHKDFTEIESFKCQLCPYQAKYKGSLNRHLLTHRNYNEAAIFQCSECPHKSKSRSDLKKHMLSHNRSNETGVFKCEQCSFGSKSKSVLTIHIGKAHQTLVNMFECDQCLYKTKYKRYFQKHVLVHEKVIKKEEPSPPNTFDHTKLMLVSENYLFDQTKLQLQKVVRKRRRHSGPNRLWIFKCNQCEYETKKKLEYEKHILVHKLGYEMEQLKCHQCAYETMNVLYYKKHMLIHESSLGLPVFKCHECCFETMRKSNLKLHLRRMHTKKDAK